jgi:hypothetical protein
MAGVRDRPLLPPGSLAPDSTLLLAPEDEENEAVFLFETDKREAVAEQARRIQESAPAWRTLRAGEIRLAEHAYSWTRSESSASRELHVGLGL